MIKHLFILYISLCIPAIGKAFTMTQYQSNGIVTDSIAPDPEDEDYVFDSIPKSPKNIAEGQNVLKAILENRYRGHDEEFKKKWYDNLFLEAGLGFEKTIHASDDYDYIPLTMMHVSVGKSFTPLHSIRATFGAGYSYQKVYEKPFWKFEGRMDYLFNMSAFAKGFNPARPFEVQFLIGAGIQYTKRQRYTHRVSPEIYTGFQFKCNTGAYGQLNIEPYIGFTKNSADFSVLHSWKKFDIYYGVNMNFVHYLNNNFAKTQQNVEKDYAPMFVQMAFGGYGGQKNDLSVKDALGHETSISLGKWLTSAIGVRGTFYNNNNTLTMHLSNKIKGAVEHTKYNAKYYSNRGGFRTEALINPLGFKRNYNWDASWGGYLLGGVGYGWLVRWNTEDKSKMLSTPIFTYTAGINLWKRIDQDIQFFMESRFISNTYNAPYTDTKYYNRQLPDKGFAIDFGVSVNLRTKRYRELTLKTDSTTQHEIKGHQPKTPFTFGISAMLPLAESHYMSYSDMTGVSYGVKFFGQYHFNDISSARLNLEYMSLFRANISSYTDKYIDNGITVSRSRVGLLGFRNGLLTATANYSVDLVQLMAGHTSANRPKKFHAEIFAGSGVTIYMTRTHTLWEEENLVEGHETDVKDHEVSAHYTMAFGGKLTFNITPHLGVYAEPTLYLIDGLKMPGYIPLRVGNFRIFKSIGLGVQYRL